MTTVPYNLCRWGQASPKLPHLHSPCVRKNMTLVTALLLKEQRSRHARQHIETDILFDTCSLS